jgi:hypothetical protein
MFWIKYKVIKSRRMRWVGHVSCMGEVRNVCKILKENDHSEDLGMEGSIMLEWILGKQVERVWVGSI